MNNLGGWARLWIAITGLWLIVTGPLFVMNYPSAYSAHDYVSSQVGSYKTLSNDKAAELAGFEGDFELGPDEPSERYVIASKLMSADPDADDFRLEIVHYLHVYGLVAEGEAYSSESALEAIELSAPVDRITLESVFTSRYPNEKSELIEETEDQCRWA